MATAEAGKAIGARYVLAALAAAALTGLAYWPGLMTWDAISQYGQVVSGRIDDWHPPMMQWLWQRLALIHAGPSPMLLLQLTAYWGGLVLLAAALARQGRSGLGWAVLACGLWPLGLAYEGLILKDSLLAAVLVAAVGLSAWRGTGPRVIAAALLLLAATLRFNAFLACLPLGVALLPEAWRRGPGRLGAASVAVAVVLLAAMPLANARIGARPTGVALSLIIFDIGGITEESGIDAFPPALKVRDAVRVNRGCYRAIKWDNYADWMVVDCPLGLNAWRRAIARGEIDPYAVWARAVLAHPLAYAQHRLTHFTVNTRIRPPGAEVVARTADPNRWGYRVTPNPALDALSTLAESIAATPLGWPIVWLGLALGVLIGGWGRPVAAMTAPIALSALLYGAGYLVFSVASDLRYHLWTGIAALIALVLLMGDGQARRGRRLVWTLAPAVLAAGEGLLVRALVG